MSMPVSTPKPHRASMSPLNGISTHININMSSLGKFSGEDGNPHGITDFFSHIERNTDHKFGDEIHGKAMQMIATFSSFLRGEAKEYWGMLSREDKSSWAKLKEVYMKMFNTDREQRTRVKARSQMPSLKQKKGESLKKYGEPALRSRQRLEEIDEPFLFQRFRKGLRKKRERRRLAWRTVGDDMVTTKKLNTQVLSICEDDEDSSNESKPESVASDATQDSSTDDDDDEQESKRKK